MSTPSMRLGSVHDIINTAIIFRQFSGLITEVVSATSIKVDGDATAFFADNDIILIPLKDFVTELTINGTPTFASGVTTISVDSGSFDSSDLGKSVCLKIDITSKVLEDGYHNVINKIEGITLNQFDTGQTQLDLDNHDRYFYSRDGSGIFQSGDVFWYKYLIGHKFVEEETLIFGGIVDLTNFDVDLLNHSIQITILGHAKELERYPAFYVNDSNNKSLIKLPGFTLYQYTSHLNSEEGIKKLTLEPFASGEMDGITVDSVSNDTPIGVHVLEFRYPNEFRWSNGNWVTIASTADYDIADQGLVKVYALDGSGDSLYAMVKVGDRDSLNPYPDKDSEIWVDIRSKSASKVSRVITGSGKPIMQFDNGKETAVKLHFPRVILFDDSGGSYTDISENANTYFLDNFLDIMTGDDDAIYIFSPEPFFGIDVIFEAGLGFSTADLSFQYSTGGLTFSADMDLGTNGLVDDTDNFTVSGEIRWSVAENWQVGQIIISTSEAYFGYILKIIRNSATGTCSLQEIKRILRLFGQNGDILDLKLFQERLDAKPAEESVILTNIQNSWDVGLWYQNISLQKLLTKSLDVANYPTALRTIVDMNITVDEPTFNIWGRVPRFNYPFLPTAIFVDSDNQYLYLACELEVWRCSFVGEWEFLTRVVPSGTLNNVWITDIKKDGDILYLFAWWQHIVDDNASGKSFAYFFSYDIANDTLTNIAADQPSFYDGSICLRTGVSVQDGVSTNYYRIFGQNVTSLGTADGDYGENLCVPYRQPLFCWNMDNNNALRAADDIDNKTGDAYPNWYFDADYVGYGGVESSGPFYFAEQGYYQMADNSGDLTPQGEIGAKFCYNQQGSYLWDADENNMYGHLLLTDTNGGVYIGLKGISSTNRTKYGNLRTYDIEMFFPYCSDLNLADGLIYVGRTNWHDSGDDTKSYSYITKFHNAKANNWDKAFLYDATLNSYSNITNDLNDGVTINNAFTEVNDAIYLGYAKKFRAATFSLSSNANGYRIEYWDGAAWSECPFTAQAGADEDFDDDLISFTIPRDWATVAVVGDTEYWIRVRCNSYTSTPNLVLAQLVEYVMWDSEIDNSGDYQRYMPIALCYNDSENSLHVSLFNRESDAITDPKPFQWAYGVLDLQFEDLYFATSGSNFTLDGSFTPKHLTYNAVDNSIYLIMESIRYKDNDAYLVNAVYDPDDNSITLTQLGIPKSGEWGSLVKLNVSEAGFVYGVTNGTAFTLWEWADSFFPRIELANFSENDSVRDILTYIAQIKNCIINITPSKTLNFLSRGDYVNDITFDWNLNLIQNPMQIHFWKHYYDSVIVQWENPFDKSDGNKKFGVSGWGKKSLTIDNPLLQSPFVASFIGELLYAYFSVYKQEIRKLRSLPASGIGMIDRFNIIIPSEILDVDSGIYYFISSLTFNAQNRHYEIEGIEI